MATTIAAPAPPATTARGGRPYRLTIEQYYRMIEAGVFPASDRVELWEGQLVAKMTKNQPHVIALGNLYELLVRMVPVGWYVAQEDPIALGADKVPEPDISIVRGVRRDYPHRPPTGQDVALVVEVADTSLSKDLGEMYAAYASQAIPVYWVVNLVAGRIEVYSDPAAPATYRVRHDYGPDDQVPVVLDGREFGRVTVRDVLP